MVAEKSRPRSRSSRIVDQYVRPPRTGRQLAVWTTVWMAVAFALSLLFGAAVGEPRDGMSLGILTSGVLFIFSVDRVQSGNVDCEEE